MKGPTEKRLATEAYERILGMIQARVLKPGTLIQERRLAEMLSMSRTPLGDALAMLEAEDLLKRGAGGRLEVRELDARELMDTLDVRLILEPEAARLAAGACDPDALAALRERIEAIRDTARSGGPPPEREAVRAVDEALHAMVAEASGNGRLVSIVRSLRRQTRMFDLRSLPERLEETCGEHLAVLDALAGRDGEAAAAAMRAHLVAVRRAILHRVTGL